MLDNQNTGYSQNYFNEGKKEFDRSPQKHTKNLHTILKGNLYLNINLSSEMLELT